MPYKIGDRVRSLIDLFTDTAICGCTDPQCSDLPAGALGTVANVSVSGAVSVKFDADAHDMSCDMGPTEIEAV